jgi:4-carboxymuconolactone decarboxylase
MKRITETILPLTLCLLASGRAHSQTRDLVAAQGSGEVVVSRAGSRTVGQGPATNFTGVARVEMLFGPTTVSTRAAAGSVTFEPGARTAWHTHPRGQTLIVTAGIGRVQSWGGPINEIRQGDVVSIPPGVKHWHGATPSSAMTHIAITENLDGRSVEWLEKVTDAQYAAASQTQTPSAASRGGVTTGTEPTAAQRLMGDIAPTLAQLTDSVLFGQVWSRPGLSQRDRSLVTVSALIAMNRPDQLRSHLGRARSNGVTEEEAVEVITHLAFYAGWPSAVTAVGVAREVYRQR